jgi:hypothetical protein
MSKIWSKIHRKAVFLLLAPLFGGAGCVQRTLTVRTDPPGALVFLNDQEIGRSPVTRNFLWYGVYDVEIRLEGYQSIKGTAPVIAPWWQWVPFDFFAEAFAVTDHHDLYFALRRPNDRLEEPELIVKRAEDLRRQLRSSQRPTSLPTKPKHPAATRPHSRPATQPATRK